MRRLALIALVLVLGPGCSFWAVRGPDWSKPAGGDCTTSAVAPVVDGILAAGFVGVGVAALSEKSGCGGSSSFCFDYSSISQGAGAAFIALGAIETAAMLYGSVKAAECGRARKELGLPVAARVQPAPALSLGTAEGRVQ
jgi:hypothetical protein